MANRVYSFRMIDKNGNDWPLQVRARSSRKALKKARDSARSRDCTLVEKTKDESLTLNQIMHSR